MIAINFKPLGVETQYRLEIGTGEATTVDGQRDVFSTYMDDDTDVYLPVRTTSGSIRFYNAGNVWNTLVDVSDEHIPVRLLAGGSAKWTGYINKGYVGTRRLFGYNEACEISVQCPLLELDTEYYTPTSTDGMITLDDVITQILTNPFGSGTTLTSQKTASIQQGIVLGMYVSVSFFMKELEEDDGTISAVPKFTRKEALEKVLRMACLTAYWDGTKVVITSIKQDNASTELVPDPADTESYVTAVTPYKKVVVTAEPNEANDFIQLPTQKMQDWERTYASSGTEIAVVNIQSGLILKTIAMLWGVLNQTFSGSDAWRGIQDEKYIYETSGSGVYVCCYQDVTGITGTITSYNLTPSILLNFAPFPVSNYNDPDWRNNINDTIFTIRTKAPVFIHDALLAIQMRLTLDFVDKTWNGQVEIQVAIGEGSSKKYYDPSSLSWSTTPGYFAVEVENGELKSTHNLNSSFEDVQGYCIRVNEVLSGKLEVSVRADDPNYGLTAYLVSIDSLKAEVVRHTFDPNEKNTYNSAISSGREQNDVEIDFCSERLTVNADNFLFYSSGGGYTPVLSMATGSGYKRPEQWIADTMAEMTTGKVRNLIVLRQTGDVSDGKYSYTENGTKYYETLLKKHEWADNMTEVHLIEITPK